jgi:hypothetical protein
MIPPLNLLNYLGEQRSYQDTHCGTEDKSQKNAKSLFNTHWYRLRRLFRRRDRTRRTQRLKNLITAMQGVCSQPACLQFCFLGRTYLTQRPSNQSYPQRIEVMTMRIFIERQILVVQFPKKLVPTFSCDSG